MGCVAALVFANLGSAYGTAKSGVGIVSVAVLKPDLLFKSIIPVVMAGVLGMYGLIIAILLKQGSKYPDSIRLIGTRLRCDILSASVQRLFNQSDRSLIGLCIPL